MKFTEMNMGKLLKFALLNVVFILVTLYIVFQYARNKNAPIETERSEIITRQDIVDTNGYIFRNEAVLTGAGGNTVNYLVDSGKKVAKYQAVAQVNINLNDYSINEQINAIDKKIDILDKSNINLEYVDANIEKIDRDAKELYQAMLYGLKTGKVKNAVKDRNDLLILLNKKQLIVGDAADFGSIIASLTGLRNQLKTQMASAVSSGGIISSEKSGIFYSNVDGWENIFTVTAAKNIDFNKFNELLASNPDDNIKSTAIGKVAYDYDWYLVCSAQKKKNIDYAVGKTYNILYPFSSNKSITSTLEKKIDRVDSGDVLLIFRTMIIPNDFNFSRKQSISIVFNEVTGIKVPEQALRVVEDEDGNIKKGVYILRANIVLFRELPDDECIGKYDGYYVYLEPGKRTAESTGTLNLYEDIIVNGKELYDGKTLD